MGRFDLFAGEFVTKRAAAAVAGYGVFQRFP
jgi:hypothetical protein